MDVGADDGEGEALVGLIIADGEGRFFAIGVDELLRFRAPDAYSAALESLTNGAEPQAPEADLGGIGAPPASEGVRALLDQIFSAGRPRAAPPPARRLSAWALLR